MQDGTYLHFAARNGRFLGFGFLLAFVSNVGQTFFVGLFGPDIQAEFSLSNTEWGGLYMLGTLASAAVFTWTGKFFDHMDLRLYTGLVCALLVFACGLTATVSSSLTLLLAIFLLRQAGQALASHVAVTSMARYFDAGRGRAIAIATLGFATGEALLPILTVLAIAAIGWRLSFAGVGILLALVFVPAILWLLRGHADRHRLYLAQQAESEDRQSGDNVIWSRSRVLRDPRFLLVMPGCIAPPMILTALFFNQLTLADAKGWSHEWITGSFGIYAAAGIIASLITGRLIDRFSAARLLPFMLPPLIVALLLIASFDHPLSAWPYLFLAGVNSGILVPSASALWAELYGVQNLGAIRSMVTALNVFASALGPMIVGSLMDQGVAIEQVCLLFAAWATAVALLILFARLPRARTVAH